MMFKYTSTPKNGHELHGAALALILLAYLLVGAGYAVRTPVWQAPDEPAHYNYVVQVAAHGCCPVIAPGDWDSEYLSVLTTARFAPETLGNLDALQYEDHQPPLYYLLASVLLRLSGGSLLALRLLSVLLGAGGVICAYAVGKAVLPGRPQIALGAACFVAFLPQHLAVLASVNNDALAELVIGGTLLALVIYVKGRNVPPWLFGVLIGVGLLTKLSTLFLGGVVVAALIMRWRLDRRHSVGARRASPLRLIRDITLFAIPALLLGGVWWARNVSVYGFPDVFGLRAHDAVVVGQPRTAEWIADLGVGEYLRRAVETTFQSFWGQFGWMALPLPGWMYTAILVWLALAGVGLVLGFVLRAPHPPSPSPTQAGRGEKVENPHANPHPHPLPVAMGRGDRRGDAAAWAILGLTALLAAAQYVYYNTEFVQFQGRYLYPLLIPVGIWLALGWDGWRVTAERVIRQDGRSSGRSPLRPYIASVTLIPLALLIPLSIYLLWRVIPLLAP